MSDRYEAWLERNPPHPGHRIRDDCMEGMTVAEAARKLDVSPVAFSRVVNGQAGISIELALKLEAQGWATADIWLDAQLAYDLARVGNRFGQWPPQPKTGVEEA